MKIVKTVIFFLTLLTLTPLAAQKKAETFPVLKGPYLGQIPLGRSNGTFAARLFAPGVISTCQTHSTAMFSPDGKEVYFSRIFPRPSAIFCMKQVDGVWTEPAIVKFSGKYNDLTPFISHDGNTLYFTSNRPQPDGTKKRNKGDSFWKAERTTDGWGEPQPLNIVVPNSQQQDGISITRSGRLYFNARYGKFPNWENHLFRAKLIDGKYSEPEKLPDTVNSNNVDGFSFIAPDESYIIFSSFRPKGNFGMGDLFISFRSESDNWTTPQNLGKEINSPAKEGFPYVSPDGKYFFFSSSRPSILNKTKVPDGAGNIYWITTDFLNKFRKN